MPPLERAYRQDILDLVLAKGYLAKLLWNKSVARFLKLRQPEILAEFVTIGCRRRHRMVGTSRVPPAPTP